MSYTWVIWFAAGWLFRLLTESEMREDHKMSTKLVHELSKAKSDGKSWESLAKTLSAENLRLRDELRARVADVTEPEQVP